MTLLSTYNFEGQTPGATATASSPWRLGSGTTPITVATAAAVHGTVGGRIASATSYRAVAWDESVTTAARVVDFYYTPRAVSANSPIAAMLDDTTSRGDVRVNTARTVTIRNGTSAVATSTDILALDTTYRFAWRVSTTGQELRVYEGESTSPLFTLTGPLTSASHTALHVGLTAASASYSGDFDTIRIADDWLSPVNPSVPLSTPTSFTFVPDGSAVEFDSSWNSVAGAATYELEVQKSVASVWTAFETFTVSGTSKTLTTADGVEAGDRLRGRVRAMPA